MRKSTLVTLLVVALALCTWRAWDLNHRVDKPTTITYGEPYVVVYGRDRCSNTARMKRALAEAGVPYKYQVYDDARNPLLRRMMKAQMDVRDFRLPVVDVSGQLMANPRPELVLAAYRPAN